MAIQISKFKCILLIAMSSCSNLGAGDHENEKNTVHKFLTYAQGNDFQKVQLLLMESRLSKDTFTVRNDINALKDYSSHNFISSKNNWEVSYDTATFVKYVNINVPIFLSRNDTTRVAEIKFDFDFTKKFLPDTIIAYYTLNVLRPDE